MKSNFETSLSKNLEKKFKFLDNGTNLKTELIAGLTHLLQYPMYWQPFLTF